MRAAILMAVIMVISSAPASAQFSDEVTEDIESLTIVQEGLTEIVSDSFDDQEGAHRRLEELEATLRGLWPIEECLAPLWGFQVAMIVAFDRQIDYFQEGLTGDLDALDQAVVLGGYIIDAMADFDMNSMLLDCL